MTSDSFTETVTTGWFSRIGNSIKGILLGIVMVIAAFPILFTNEGCAVKTRKTLDQGSSEFSPVDAATVDPANDGKLIHLTGQASSDEELSDNDFQVKTNALLLQRQVEMYQWQESTSKDTKKKLGGSTETTTTYNYEKVWHRGRIDSSNFKKAEGHNNPSPKFSNNSWKAKDIKLGGFTLNSALLDKISQLTPVPIREDDFSKAVTESHKKLRVHNGSYYFGKSPDAPELGDLRISYQQVSSPTEVSIIAQQKGNGFEPFIGKSGSSIYMLQVGNHSAAEMFESAQQGNKIRTWILRVVGFFVMFLGFSMIFKPLSVVADILPIAGTIVGVGTGIVSFLLAVPLSLTTIAIAWIFYRPLIGVPLLLAAGVGIFFLIKKVIAYKKASQ